MSRKEDKIKSREHLCVLESVAAPGKTTKFIDQVVRFAPESVEFKYFSWMDALLGKYDVFHIHWPEFLVRHPIQIVAFARSMLFRMLLWRIRVQGIPVVRTLHNLQPHSPGPAHERKLLERLDRLTTLIVRLNETTDTWPGPEVQTILHGHYRDEFFEYPKPDRVKGRLAYLGRIEEYKGVVALIDAFQEIRDGSLSLRVVGMPTDSLRREIVERLDNSTLVTACLEYVSDAQMVSEICQSELVVLPYLEMHNSGILLMSLSLGTPVLAPKTEANLLLSEEVGPGWIYMYEGNISAEILHDAWASVSNIEHVKMPDLSRRDWSTIGSQYAHAFESACALAREAKS